ncbi:universal stress protein [Streptomyces sp. NPDC059629]|uniref:universal stress protein n=1 Tax=Streptomyces sp. NPDC059629 TaxID=3346889 RepID=UPI00369E9ABD
MEFAFDAAARRGAALRVVHGWTAPLGDFRRFRGVELHASLARRQATALTDALRPRRRKFPGVEVIEASRCGSAAQVLVNASRDAFLAVVGRRIRTGPFGNHIAHVTPMFCITWSRLSPWSHTTAEALRVGRRVRQGSRWTVRSSSAHPSPQQGVAVAVDGTVVP